MTTATVRKPRTITFEEWVDEGTKLYGPDRATWKFKCPACGHVATGKEYLAAGATVGHIGFSCIGRFTNLPRDAFGKGQGPCNYAGGGLIGLNPVTIELDGKGHQYFEFADHVE